MNTALTLDNLPLFPLHTVLFPGGYIPLRVFEPRYCQMVRNCREQGTPFGVVTLLTGDEVHHYGEQPITFHPVGTLAAIDTMTALSTGIELLQCTGHTRFRIRTSHKQQHDLWVADVELMAPDCETPIPTDLQPTAKALRYVLRNMPQRHLAAASNAQFSDCSWVANRWAELLPVSQRMQLQLLELDSPLLRLELVSDVLESVGIVP